MGHFYMQKVITVELASVAELNMHPTGDQEVAGSIPTRSAAFIKI